MKNKVVYILTIILFICFTGYTIYKVEKQNEISANNLSNSLEASKDKNPDIYEAINQEKEDYESSFYLLFSDIQGSALAFGLFFITIAVCTHALWWVCRLLNTKTFSYFYLREKNSKFIKNIILKYYKYVLVVPICIGFIFLYGLFCKSFNINDNILGRILVNETLLKNGFLFFALLIIKIVLEFAFYINMALVMARVNKKFLLSFFSSVLLILGFEFLIGNCHHLITSNYWITYVSTWTALEYDTTSGILAPLVFPTIMFIISFILVILSFKNKEKLLLDYETKD